VILVSTLDPPLSTPAPRARLGTLLGRHQVASILSTAVDFGVMVLVVELLHLSPVVGTGLGATAGAITNFQLGRRWIFEAHDGAVAGQMARYAMVSGASAGWNALGEWGLHDGLGVQYLAARAVIAVLVSFLWNFPMQRYFVFRKGRA
jgi:putative flippase GtrA